MCAPMAGIILALLASCALQAQSAASPIEELRKASWGYEVTKANLIKAAEEIPDADYAYRPAPGVRTIAELFGHITDVQARLCGMVTGEQKQLNAGKMTAKADIVPALKTSFAVCDAAWEKLTESNANETVGSGRSAQTRFGEMEHVVIHDNEEYGYLAVYLRLRNIVPPSSDRGNE